MGLGGEWRGVIGALQEIIPVYDRVNYAISLGRASRIRRRCISGRVARGEEVLDAGSGFGNMASTAGELCGGEVSVTLYDALVPMLLAARTRARGARGSACGVFEHMPFGDGRFDVVMCGYSLRDAISLRAAIAEIHRVLGDGGRLLIADLGKPDSRLLRAGVAAYLRFALPVIAVAAGGRRGARFAALYPTWARWPANARLRQMLQETFSRVEYETDLGGGAIMVAAYK